MNSQQIRNALFIIQDELDDAAHAEQQIKRGDFYPEKGITKESLESYAAQCRQHAADLQKSIEGKT